MRSRTQQHLNLYAVEGLRTLCIAKRVSAGAGRARPRAPRALTHVSAQVLSPEEYTCWLQSHLEAESAVDNREELLFESATRLETNLHLLGNPPAHMSRGPVASWQAGGDRTLLGGSSALALIG